MIADAGPLRFQPAADVRLAASAAVRVGRVEHGDAEIDRAVHQLVRLRFVLAHAEEGRRRSDAAEVAAPEDQPRDCEIGGSQPPIVHRPRAYSDPWLLA